MTRKERCGGMAGRLFYYAETELAFGLAIVVQVFINGRYIIKQTL